MRSEDGGYPHFYELLDAFNAHWFVAESTKRAPCQVASGPFGRDSDDGPEANLNLP